LNEYEFNEKSVTLAAVVVASTEPEMYTTNNNHKMPRLYRERERDRERGRKRETVLRRISIEVRRKIQIRSNTTYWVGQKTGPP